MRGIRGGETERGEARGSEGRQEEARGAEGKWKREGRGDKGLQRTLDMKENESESVEETERKTKNFFLKYFLFIQFK